MTIQLDAPFPDEAVGKLPRITCGACRDSADKSCPKHKKVECRTCKNWISPKHIHLDYVGHAHVTERLLLVDPSWTWEPRAVDANGLPVLDANGGLWINLTINGVTRPGYGDADGKRGGKAVKEAIGDAIRNAAMRFGVALEYWKKESKEIPVPVEREVEPRTNDEVIVDLAAQLRRQILALHRGKGDGVPEVEQAFLTWSNGTEIAAAKVEQLTRYMTKLQQAKS